MTRTALLEHVHEGKRRKLLKDCELPQHTTGPNGVLTLVNSLYWCPVTGEAWAALSDCAKGEFQIYATGLYFDKPFTSLTRGSVRMIAALLSAAGRSVATIEQPDGDTALEVITQLGRSRVVSAALLASNVARYAACNPTSLVQQLISSVG